MPITVKKRDYSDTYNQVEVTWTDREKGYQLAVAIAKDEVDQRVSQNVRKKTVDLRGITNPMLAQYMAQRILIDALYRLSSYTFTVGYKNMRLENSDIITVNDGYRVIDEKMRVISVNEDVNGRGLNIEAIEDLTAYYPDPEIIGDAVQGQRTEETAIVLADSFISYRIDPANNLLILSISPGNIYCNGWYIYRSYDGNSYDLVGMCTIDGVDSGKANSIGTLITDIPVESGTVAETREADNTFEVDIGIVTDLDTAITEAMYLGYLRLAKVGDEIIAYKTCEEQEESGVDGIWRITDIIRGLYGTEIVTHEESGGEVFSTLNPNFNYLYRDEDIGNALYFKALPFYGKTVQSISDVTGTAIEIVE